MEVLVVGSEGFIGKYCVRHFGKSHDIVACGRQELETHDYSYQKISGSSSDFDNLFRGHDFSLCINASGSANVQKSIECPEMDFEANVGVPSRILESIRRYSDQCKYLNLSSAAVYGKSEKPMQESYKINPVSPYGRHKYISELLCKEYFDSYGISTCSLRLFSVYGPGNRKQVFWAIFKQLKKSGEVVLSGDGLESRDFIYAEDLINAMDLIVQKSKFNAEAINVGSGNYTILKDAAEIFLSYMVPECELRFDCKNRPGDTIHMKADIEKLKGLGFAPQVSLDEGLKNYADWLSGIK
jgi:UDP-glucose 4-epimerase